MRERNYKVEGSGAKAVVYGIQIAPRPVPIGGDADWGTLTRTARNF
jgi:hypothetical protein